MVFDLYKHIEDLGKAHGYKNMTALCAAAGVPRSNMSELKMGRSATINAPTAQKFAALLHVSLDAVYGEADHDKSHAAPALSPQDARLLSAYRRAPPADRAII